MVIQESNAVRVGIVGSLTMHLLLFFAVGVWNSVESALQPPAPDPREAEQEVTLLFPDDVPPELTPEVAPESEPEPGPDATPAPVPPMDSQNFVRSTGSSDVPEAPVDAPFVSDRNTVASSRLLPGKDGTSDRPTTTGGDTPNMALSDQQYRDGEQHGSSAAPAPVLLVPPPTPQPPVPAVTATPPVPPVPVPVVPEPVPPTPAPPAATETPLPDLAKSDQLTPSEQMLRDLENELRKADSVDTPPPAPRQPATALEMRSPLDSQPDPTSADTPPSPETTGTSPSVAAGMTPETRTAETKGSISNIGEEDSVAAAATPVGRYMRQVTSAVEKKWHYFRTQEADAVEPGRLSLRFYVNKFGKVEDLKFTMKDANALMEDFTIEAILKAEIPPIPSDLLPVLDKERLEINYDIVIHP